jgi:hypothetical protein
MKSGHCEIGQDRGCFENAQRTCEESAVAPQQASGHPHQRSNLKARKPARCATPSGTALAPDRFKDFLEMTMTKPTKSQADLLALLVDDTRRFGHGLSGGLRRVSHAIRRRLWGGDPEVLEGATKARTKPDLLAVLEDDVRQCAGAVGSLFGQLNRLRGGTNRSALTTSESAVSAEDPARQA